MEEARAENESLKEKINGLKQQYGPIGKQVREKGFRKKNPIFPQNIYYRMF